MESKYVSLVQAWRGNEDRDNRVHLAYVLLFNVQTLKLEMNCKI